MNQVTNTNQIPLPPGWIIKAEPLVGVSCLDSSGFIVSQHPVDNEAFRHLCWDIFYNRIAFQVAQLLHPEAKECTPRDRQVVNIVLSYLVGEIKL